MEIKLLTGVVDKAVIRGPFAGKFGQFQILALNVGGTEFVKFLNEKDPVENITVGSTVKLLVETSLTAKGETHKIKNLEVLELNTEGVKPALEEKTQVTAKPRSLDVGRTAKDEVIGRMNAVTSAIAILSSRGTPVEWVEVKELSETILEHNLEPYNK
jgi:hypothetical protein